MTADRDDVREDLTARADRARSDLLQTVGVLGQRGRQAAEVPSRVRRDPRVWALGAILAAAGAGLGAATWMSRRTDAPRRRRRARWKLLDDVWHRPDRARRSERGSLAEEVARSIAVSLLTAAITLPLKSAVARWLEPEVRRRPAPQRPVDDQGVHPTAGRIR